MALYVEAGFDLADLGGYVLDVVETGGNTFTVTLASGTYFLRTDGATAAGDYASKVTGYDDLLGAIEAALDAGTGGGGYSVSFSTSTNRVTITHDGGGGVTAVQLTATTNGGLIGQTATKSSALTHEMDVTPDYWIDCDFGWWADWDEYENDEDVAWDEEAWDGTPTGGSRSGVATFVDLTVPLELEEAVYTHKATSSAPWTWRDLFRHVRNLLPICLDDGTTKHFLRLRARGSAFKPRELAGNYRGHFDIPLRTRLLGRI